MRSPTALASALTILLTFPLAIAAQIVSDGSAELVVHIGIGTGSILLAFALFDFALPRWLNWTAAAAAGTFGAIFLLQALSQVVNVDALRYVAFDVLGQEIEGALPYVILAWFVALLLGASQGKSRIFGLGVLSIVVGVEVASVIGPVVGFTVESQKLLFLLPFVWLIVESIERHGAGDAANHGDRQVLAESPTS